MSLLLAGRTTKTRLLLMAVAGAFLLWLAWPPFKVNAIIFVALIPLLSIIDRITATSETPAFKITLFSYICFVLWNLFTTWWIWLASPAGAAMAIILNALLMTLPVFFYYRVRRYTNRWTGYFALICFWLSLELLHFNWDAPWPWLSLGNVFSESTYLVQWYEYTGIMGGTVWIWLVNILIYESLTEYYPAWFPTAHNLVPAAGTRPAWWRSRRGIITLAVLLVPTIISLLLKPKETPLNSKHNIVVVQPNIDPYSTKFDSRTYGQQINTLIQLSEAKIDSQTALVVWPETAVAEDGDESELFFTPSIKQVHEFIKRHPHIKLLTGTSSYTTYTKAETPTARRFHDNSAYFDLFNSALLLDTSDHFEIYHKSKLVPGVEKMPYPGLFGFLEALIIDLGGTSGSLGSQDSPEVFRVNDQLTVAPVICYESIFGEYVGRYIRQGANVIAIITNDGWWDNTPGYKQHLSYARLRAIETRKFIARSANTGISCFILPDGEILTPTNYWEPAVLKSGYTLNDRHTFYTRYGDYLGIMAKWLGFGFLFIAFFGGLIRKFLGRAGTQKAE